MILQKLKTLNNMLADDDTILDFVQLPEAAAELNESALKAAIIRRCGDCEPYYQIPQLFKFYGALWFNTHDFLFDHAIKILDASYNPIENYDRSETYSGTSSAEGEASGSLQHGGSDSDSKTTTYNVTDTHGGSDSESKTTTYNVTDTHGGSDSTSKSATSEKEIAGFNSSDYVDSEKLTESEQSQVTHGETLSKTGTETEQSQVTHGETLSKTGTEAVQSQVTHGETLSKTGTETEQLHATYGKTETRSDTDSRETSDSHTSRVHGNIGVTTSQQMLLAEKDLADKFWIYDYIASAFESDNFITAYNSYYEGAQWED